MRQLRGSCRRLGSWLVAMLTALPGTLLAGSTSFAAEPVWCHKVRAGDTLSSIARRYKVSLAKLRGVNAPGIPRTLPVGRTLALPPLVTLPQDDVPWTTAALRARTGHLRLENRGAERDDLTRMRDLGMVTRFRKAGLLVPLRAETATYYVAGVAPPLRVARPWTRRFVEQFAAALHGLFGTRLRVTSLTRTTLWQLALRRTNASAAAASGPLGSSHLTGASVDLSKRGLSAKTTSWMRTVLRRLHAQRLVHATEEFHEPHFHVLVRRRYAAYAATLGSPLLIGGC